ncbi:FAD-dependent oxidoreductase [Microbacterium sp. No. 7]|uniref:FAD-dependent oxidoreductase n=1 Tax=Microbacterium sp. No. 7 TaxID=1714373 RepID=UPI0006D0D4E5|nr:FAD-dependent oxidoreductase [Microbacterium sp. No. 7]ALJ21868.1 hypothetical protein AOA12_18990 [Microbacterium sp. No. 7]
MPHVITQSCCNDTACTVVCPVDCIHPTPAERRAGSTEMLYIDPNTCIDCGSCVVECPVGAIYADHNLPDDLADYAKVNADFFETAWPALGEVPRREVGKPAVARTEELRVAVIGSGPSGCYAALELLERGGSALRVDFFDRLPTPWGLARAGIAPDHLHTKAVAERFAEHARDPRLRFFFNVEVGTHVSVAELAESYHAVIFATGASSSRALGIPGEDLPGSHPATAFVAWYNAHPDAADARFDLTTPRAVIVGNGNVAMDVARMLTASPAQLQHSDAAEHAVRALTAGSVREVVLLARRGPLHAAFTSPELRALGSIPGLRVAVDPADLELTPNERRLLGESFAPRLKYELLSEYAARDWGDADRTIRLRFFSAPVRVLGDDRVEAIEIERTRSADAGEQTQTESTGVLERIPTGLVLRAVGYRGIPIEGLPFDEARGILPNDGARIVEPPSGAPVRGMYTVGWIKRGPSGVLGTNKQCASDTVAALLDDHRADRLADPTRSADDVDTLLRRRQPALYDWDGWRRIDEYELLSGRRLGRPRAKVADRSRLVEIGLGGDGS